MVKMVWDIHRWETDALFQNLLDYGDLLEEQLSRVCTLDKLRIHAGPPIFSEEDFADWQVEVNLHEERYEKDFPGKIRYSFIVLLQIIIETRLRAACDEIFKRRELQLTESDMRGGAIDRARLFLERVANVSVADSQLWQELTDLQKIRDCIVHTNGFLAASRDGKRLREIAKCKVGISLDPSGSLAIDQEYCRTAVGSARRFFKELFGSAGFGPIDPVIT